MQALRAPSRGRIAYALLKARLRAQTVSSTQLLQKTYSTDDKDGNDDKPPKQPGIVQGFLRSWVAHAAAPIAYQTHAKSFLDHFGMSDMLVAPCIAWASTSTAGTVVHLISEGNATSPAGGVSAASQQTAAAVMAAAQAAKMMQPLVQYWRQAPLSTSIEK